MSTATTGTGPITLGSAVAGFLSFASAGIGDGETVTYAIQDGAASEIGRGVYTASGTTLTRSVLKSTSAGAAITLSGTAQVFITPSAEDIIEFPSSVTDNSVPRWDGTNGRILQTSALVVGDTGGLSGIPSLNTGPLAGFRNRLLNGCMRINQRAPATNADDTYAHDRWNILTQTGTVAVSSVTAIEDAWIHAMRITQSQASAQMFGVSQIIEAINCQDLRGQAVTLSARVRMSASTTLRYAILEWTGTADSVTSDVVNSWTNATFTAGNFFITAPPTVTATGSTALTANTAATVSLSTTLGSSVNNVIVFFWTDSTQAQNVTFDIGKVQFEPGSVATIFEARSYAAEFALCQRYYQIMKVSLQSPTTGDFLYGYTFPQPMRATPTATVATGEEGSIGSATVTTSFGGGNDRGGYFQINASVASGFVIGRLVRLAAEL